MNIFYSIRHKGKLAVLLLAVVLLEISSSNLYTDNINQMSDSFSELYADRLIAQDYIYKLAEILHKRKYTLIQQNNENTELNNLSHKDKTEISLLLNNYEKTQLTPSENALFKDFKNNLSSLMAMDQRFTKSSNNNLKQYSEKQNNLLTLSLEQLEQLSEIQLSRGKNLNETSLKTASFSNLLNQFDMAIVIIIGIAIQAIVFASTSTIPKSPQNHLLN
ncbi:MAG: MCP four helix bundle domain-containing protein [Bacteroidota bacterium]